MAAVLVKQFIAKNEFFLLRYSIMLLLTNRTLDTVIPHQSPDPFRVHVMLRFPIDNHR